MEMRNRIVKQKLPRKSVNQGPIAG